MVCHAHSHPLYPSWPMSSRGRFCSVPDSGSFVSEIRDENSRLFDSVRVTGNGHSIHPHGRPILLKISSFIMKQNARQQATPRGRRKEVWARWRMSTLQAVGLGLGVPSPEVSWSCRGSPDKGRGVGLPGLPASDSTASLSQQGRLYQKWKSTNQSKQDPVFLKM